MSAQTSQPPQISLPLWWITIGALLALRCFVWFPFVVASGSMEPTYATGSRVYALDVPGVSVRRGDVVMLSTSDALSLEDQARLPYETLMKRVVGLGGETIEASGGVVFVDGVELDEPYLDGAVVTSDFGPVSVPEGMIFVMGDNRAGSWDSRVFGVVPEEAVVGILLVDSIGAHVDSDALVNGLLFGCSQSCFR